MSNILMLHPIDPANLTQGFGENPAIYAQFGLKGHNGLDYRTKYPDSTTGKRDVRAPFWGKVIEAADQGKAGYGKFLRIELVNNNGQVVLGHLDSFKVKVGDSVTPGQVIAISDNTGFSTGAHLHFGYRPFGWNQQNGYAGYENQAPMMTSDLQKVLAQMDTPVPGFAAQFNGKILVAVQDHGRKWYVWDGHRYEIDKAPAFELLLQRRPPPAFSVFISNVDLSKIPVGV